MQKRCNNFVTILEGDEGMKQKQMKLLFATMGIAVSMFLLVPCVSEDKGTAGVGKFVVLENLHDVADDATENIGKTRNAVDVVETALEEQTVPAAEEQTMPVTEEQTVPVEEDPIVIADVTNYVNVRSLPSEEGEIIGKLYDDSVGTKISEENGWYRIQSGSVDGYVKAEYVLTGTLARQRADEVGKRLAEVTTTTLKVRKHPSIDAQVLGLVPGGDVLAVTEEVEGWVKVSIEEGDGYISTDYAHVYTENVEAESKAEEEARLKKEEEERRKAEEAAKRALEEERKKQEAERKRIEAEQKKQEEERKKAEQESQKKPSSSSSNEQTSDLGTQIANYALKFVGNPYVYGGTSLTNGADCSGFVMSVYKHFGIQLPRTSGEQGKSGSGVSGLENAKAGDLIWYSGHIGIYIGNGKVVHASSPKNGIIVSKADYRTILGIRRIV